MGKGLPRSHASSLIGLVNVIKIPLNGAGGVGILEIDGATGVGFGSMQIGGFPEGNILFLGAACCVAKRR